MRRAAGGSSGAARAGRGHGRAPRAGDALGRRFVLPASPRERVKEDTKSAARSDPPGGAVQDGPRRPRPAIPPLPAGYSTEPTKRVWNSPPRYSFTTIGIGNCRGCWKNPVPT